MAEGDPSRIAAKTSHLFVKASEVPPMKIAAVENVSHKDFVGRLMFVGENIMLLQAERKKGMIDPWHQHDDHEAMGYLVSGKMRVIIGDTEMICTAGCAWVHPQGVPHYSEALEDSVQIEIKSPPRKNWTEQE